MNVVVAHVGFPALAAFLEGRQALSDWYVRVRARPSYESGILDRDDAK